MSVGCDRSKACLSSVDDLTETAELGISYLAGAAGRTVLANSARGAGSFSPPRDTARAAAAATSANASKPPMALKLHSFSETREAIARPVGED